MSILFAVLALLLAAVGAVVLLSNLFAWYEAVNMRPDLMASRESVPQFLSALRRAAGETLLLFLTLLLRPFGWIDPKPVKSLGSKRVPVLLLHGLFHNRACLWWMGRRLRALGLPVFAINLPLWRGNLGTAAAIVDRKIDQLRISIGAEKIHLLGYSMGGLVARKYLQVYGTGKVERCILLGSPNHGSKLAAMAVSPLGKSLLPGSDLLAALPPAAPPGVRMTAIFSAHDNLILPAESARLEGARSIELENLQHTGLLYHPEAINAVIAELTEPI